MSGNDENAIRPQNLQGGLRVGTIKFVSEMGQNRIALSNINTNLVAPPAYPAAVNKRGLSEKHAISEKNPLFPVHRPVTRKYAAQMANKQSCSDYPVKDGETASDLSVPMNHTESVLNDMEVEMEDIGVEPSTDIDVCDLKNPLAVVEYVEEIYSFYRKAESSSCVSPTYMSQQIDINEKMRAILIDWLIEVHYKFELMDETLFLTVNLIDRFLACQSIVRKKLQLVGITAMLLACKYEEVSVPVVEDLILISDKAYTRKEVLDMERLMVNKLQFNMSVPTPYVFVRRFLKASQFDKKLELLSFFMMELCLVEYKMLKYPPSLLAAAAIYTAQCTLDGSKKWSKTSEWHSTYSEDELLECSRLMVAFHQKAGAGKLTGVHRKYSTFKFGYAAKSEPAEFLLEKKL